MPHVVPAQPLNSSFAKCRPECLAPQVPRVEGCTDPRGENKVVRATERRPLAMLLERFREPWRENNVAHRMPRFRRHVASLAVNGAPDMNQLIVEIDVPPAEAEQFALSQTGENRSREQRPDQLKDVVNGYLVEPPSP